MEMMDRALNDERTVRQQQQAEIVNAQRERDDARRNAHHWTMRYNNDINQLQIERDAIRQQLQQCRANGGLLEYNRDRLYDRYLKWKAKEFNSWQIILNLQNNPPGNMATLQDVMQSMAPLLAREEPYVGQEAPDDYFNRISQILAYGD